MVNEAIIIKNKKIPKEKGLNITSKIPKVVSKVKDIGSSAFEGRGFVPTRPKTFDTTYSKEQRLLQDMFGGNPVLNDDEFNPPVLNGVMRKGGGILKCGDTSKRTASMFGLFRRY